MVYRGPFQAIWDLSTPALKRIVAYGPKHLQYEAAQRELARRNPEENTMDILGHVPAEELTKGQVIIDPEGNEATVVRIQRIDHQRGRLATDLGVAVVPLSQKFPVVA